MEVFFGGEFYNINIIFFYYLLLEKKLIWVIFCLIMIFKYFKKRVGGGSFDIDRYMD